MKVEDFINNFQLPFLEKNFRSIFLNVFLAYSEVKIGFCVIQFPLPETPENKTA